jgi:hypothetical protein
MPRKDRHPCCIEAGFREIELNWYVCFVKRICFLSKSCIVGIVCHDECSSTSAIVNTVVAAKHINVCDAGDTWHAFKNIEKQAKVLEQQFPTSLPGLSSKLKSVIRNLLHEFPNMDQVDARVAGWRFYNFRENWNSQLPQYVMDILDAFMRSTSVVIAKLVPFGTSACESYNNHNLVFFSKHQFYAPEDWQIRMYASYLAWNDVEGWFSKFVAMVISEVLK